MAKHLAERGVLVFAGCLKGGGEGAVALRSYGFEGLHVLQMDVTSEEEVKKCVAYVREKTNGVGKQLYFSVEQFLLLKFMQ